MWFTETAWPPLMILGLVAVGFLWAALQTQAAKWLIAIGVCVVLAIAVWFVEQSIVTPSEQVEANLLAMVEAFQKNDEPATLQYISTAPASAGLVALAKIAIKLVDMDDGYSVSDIQIRTMANETAATSHFRVNGTIAMSSQGSLGHKPFRFLGQWRLETGQWRLTAIEDLDPINGKALNRFEMLK